MFRVTTNYTTKNLSMEKVLKLERFDINPTAPNAKNSGDIGSLLSKIFSQRLRARI